MKAIITEYFKRCFQKCHQTELKTKLTKSKLVSIIYREFLWWNLVLVCQPNFFPLSCLLNYTISCIFFAAGYTESYFLSLYGISANRLTTFFNYIFNAPRRHEQFFTEVSLNSTIWLVIKKPEYLSQSFFE